MEIRESIEDSQKNKAEDQDVGHIRKTSRRQSSPLSEMDALALEASLGDFEKELFKRMDALEVEEKKESQDGDGDENSETDEDDESFDLERDQEVTMREDEEEDPLSDHEHEGTDLHREGATSSFQESLSQRHVRFSEVVDEKEIPSRKDSTEHHLPNPQDERKWIPIRDLVVEKAFLEDEDAVDDLCADESYVEEYQFGRQLALEYARKKNQLQNANLISNPRREVLEVIYIFFLEI